MIVPEEQVCLRGIDCSHHKTTIVASSDAMYARPHEARHTRRRERVVHLCFELGEWEQGEGLPARRPGDANDHL